MQFITTFNKYCMLIFKARGQKNARQNKNPHDSFMGVFILS